MRKIFSPCQLGDIDLANRIVMAPMTRSRAGAQDEPLAMTVDYYAQRARAGLIITEGVYPAFEGKGYARTPGLINDVQARAWQNVVSAVHDHGGKIVMQIMHCGRIVSHLNRTRPARVLAPSALRAAGDIFTEQGMAPFETPEEMSLDDIRATIAAFAATAQRARDIGFDGVELHATSGYLPAQFLSTGTNQRQDEYGGSLAHRARFVIELLQVMAEKVGAGRVGMRISPGNTFNDLHDDDPVATYTYLLDAIGPMRLAYLHVIRMNNGIDAIALAKNNFTGPILANESYDLAEAEAALAAEDCSAVSFGRAFISNPDLVDRFESGAPLAPINFKTLYTPGPEGYSDYPAHAEG